MCIVYVYVFVVSALVKCLCGHCGMRGRARMGSTSSLSILSAFSFNFSLFLNGLLSTGCVRIKQHFASDGSLGSVGAGGCGGVWVWGGGWVVGLGLLSVGGGI